ncbi:hypothetical protein PGT21_013527 [Puccinia graminis f. sp. tritici]|uniref:Uncharacterized protein n=1 Tax=Puccinia graminis f. sp. tritici TaxID=56615 RepID=A0A5B0QT33_PUCGR|nr:hypothetical protein PGT21_013527 [Puccinia graminis f. sp. tritici]
MCPLKTTKSHGSPLFVVSSPLIALIILDLLTASSILDPSFLSHSPPLFSVLSSLSSSVSLPKSYVWNSNSTARRHLNIPWRRRFLPSLDRTSSPSNPRGETRLLGKLLLALEEYVAIVGGHVRVAASHQFSLAGRSAPIAVVPTAAGPSNDPTLTDRQELSASPSSSTRFRTGYSTRLHPRQAEKSDRFTCPKQYLYTRRYPPGPQILQSGILSDIQAGSGVSQHPNSLSAYLTAFIQRSCRI